MQALDFGDELEIDASSEEDIPLPKDNLVTKAIDLYRHETGLHFPLKVRLSKRVPMQAGLGGGSSNAATTLWGINSLADNYLSEMDLIDLSAKLGSDVPFFFSKGTAYCWGRGELFEEADPELTGTIWIAKPDFGLSTPEVYRYCTPNADSAHFDNDLEKSAYFLNPKLAQTKIALQNLGFQKVTMTGSGSAFYCQGDVKDPCLSEVTFIKTKPLNRLEKDWYRNEKAIV